MVENTYKDFVSGEVCKVEEVKTYNNNRIQAVYVLNGKKVTKVVLWNLYEVQYEDIGRIIFIKSLTDKGEYLQSNRKTVLQFIEPKNEVKLALVELKKLFKEILKQKIGEGMLGILDEN